QLEEEQDLKWRVFDQLGRMVVEQTAGLRAGAGQWSKQIDLNGQPAGIYFVEVYGEHGSTALKVVKQ
ncbi:MAG: T9SS type A sorting domain-containing protein, partial [Saprospiraceae bacterium]|nr:T9SS type A sorting domain-containing protein [Saprospiraceae bacterium]